MKDIKAYKLVRLRKDGTLGPLFINRKARLPVGKWLKAKAVRSRWLTFRPGWHACQSPSAPHMVMTGRVWCKVLLRKARQEQRPPGQGGMWYVAKEMKVVRVMRT